MSETRKIEKIKQLLLDIENKIRECQASLRGEKASVRG